MTENTATKDTATDTFDQWAIVELMGHVRLAGRVTEESHFGSALGRIDIPGPDDGFVTQYFAGASIYRVTPVAEDVARAVAANNRPQPVHRWELPTPETPTPPAEQTPIEAVADDVEDDDRDDYDERHPW